MVAAGSSAAIDDFLSALHAEQGAETFDEAGLPKGW